MEQEDWEGARTQYRRLVQRLGSLKPALLRRRPDLTTLYADAAESLAKLEALEGNYEEAISLLERISARLPEDAPIYLTDIAVCKIAQGEVEKGLTILRALIEGERDNPWHQYLYAKALMRVQRYEEAREAILPIVLHPPERERDLFLDLGGSLLFEIGEIQRNLDLAIQGWERLRAAGKPDWELGVRLVFLMAQAGDVARGRQYLRQIRGRCSLPLAEGYLLWAEGAREGARSLWERAAKRWPDEEPVSEQRSFFQALLLLGHPREVLDSLMDWEGSRWESHLFRAIALAQVGDLGAAVAAMERTVKRIKFVEILLEKVPLYQRRLWKDFLSPEAWERLEPFFAPEPA